jgi:quercetin dioxygenase-like cupin family protein
MTQVEIGDIIDMVGSRFQAVARMGGGENDTVLFRTRMAPGRLVPLHSHADPECFYLLEGSLDVFVVDDAPGWRVVNTGESLLLAGGVKHAVRNAASVGADIVLATNNRFARFLLEAGRRVAVDAPFVPPTPEDIGRLLRVSASYGYWNATPAESAAVTG